MIYQSPWKKQLSPASFRGVPFSVKSVQTSVGRRVVVHKYPQRKGSYPEDMGPEDDAFTIEAFIVGPDYFKARDALIGALKQPGAGLLVHPYYGRKTVTLVAPARISERTDEGGIARFSLDFVEAGENTEPTARPDTRGAVDRCANAANDSAITDFAAQFSVANVAGFVESSAMDMAREAMSTLDMARRSLVPDVSILSDYLAAANGVVGQLNKLIRSPAALAQNVLGIFGAFKALAKSPIYAFNSYKGLFSYGSNQSPVRPTTASRVRQASNQVALASLTRRGALIEAARTSSQVDFATYDEAVAVRETLAQALENEAAGIVPAPVGNGSPETMHIEVSDSLYQALVMLRAAVIRDITDRAVKAPRLRPVVLPSTMPALVAAYKIYGDAGRADEIMARNPRAGRHPGFLPGGRELEIIVD